MYKENVVVLYSGGMGSFLSAHAIREHSPDSEMTLYFNDTLVERRDLYRFMLDTINYFWPSSSHSYLRGVANTIPVINEHTTEADMERRAKILRSLGSLMMVNYPSYVYDAEGLNIWQVFERERFIGNNRKDTCSKFLKRVKSHSWIKSNFSTGNADIAIGIDWSERHRWERARKNWDFNLVAPLIDLNLDKSEYEAVVLADTGIKRSEAYDIGLAHDNCGGFCVKAGLGHFKLLWEKDPSRYLYHERKLEEAMESIGRYPFLKKTVNKQTYYVSMKEYREYLETGKLVVDGDLIVCEPVDQTGDALDIGGCGCAI